MTWVPFEYRDFYDVPRAIVFRSAGRAFFLTSDYDDVTGNYSDAFDVYELDRAADTVGSWLALRAEGVLLGTVDVASIEFDGSRRRELRPDSPGLAEVLRLTRDRDGG